MFKRMEKFLLIESHQYHKKNKENYQHRSKELEI